MVKYWIKNISGNIKAVFLKLGTTNVHHKIPDFVKLETLRETQIQLLLGNFKALFLTASTRKKKKIKIFYFLVSASAHKVNVTLGISSLVVTCKRFLQLIFISPTRET